jgi:hypothetical protein
MLFCMGIIDIHRDWPGQLQGLLRGGHAGNLNPLNFGQDLDFGDIGKIFPVGNLTSPGDRLGTPS